MRLLLVANYEFDKQESMLRFADLLRRELTAAGHEVRMIRPDPLIGRLRPAASGLGKWLGYVDRFILFRRKLTRALSWAEVVHICDHGNSMYVHWLKGKPNVVTCHDLLAIRSARGEIPKRSTRWTGRLYQRWIMSGLRKSTHVCCVSEATRSDLLRVGNLVSSQVSVVENALNYPYSPMSGHEAIDKLRVLGVTDKTPFFLHVGGNQWYKNRVGLVRIFNELSRVPRFGRHKLFLVGKPWTEEIRGLVDDLELGDRIRELCDVSSEDLRALYSLADALIFPSLHEGFGWPILEAQASGCPVFTSNRPPMTDVGGSGAVYFDPECETQAAQRIAAGLNHAQSLRDAGFRNMTRFSVDRMVRGYLTAYHSLIPVNSYTSRA